jgi:hypothetical protein
MWQDIFIGPLQQLLLPCGRLSTLIFHCVRLTETLVSVKEN